MIAGEPIQAKTRRAISTNPNGLSAVDVSVCVPPRTDSFWLANDFQQRIPKDTMATMVAKKAMLIIGLIHVAIHQIIFGCNNVKESGMDG